MGLGLNSAVRNAFFEKHGALSRGNAADLEAGLVVIDLSAVLRAGFAATGKRTTTPAQLGNYVHRRYIKPHVAATSFAVVFDSYGPDDLHRLRIEMHTNSRHRKATEEELEYLDSSRQVVVNGRIYPLGKHPYTDSEVALWQRDTELVAERAISNKTGKLRLYEIVLESMIRTVVDSLHRSGGTQERQVIFDTPKTWTDPESIVTVRYTGSMVVVEKAPRCTTIGRHGEADQKVAAYLAQLSGAPAVWHTVDMDAVAQCTALGLNTVTIVYPAPRGDKDRRSQLVTMGRLPQGTAAAFALLRDGGDYSRSGKVFNVHSEQLLNALEAENPPILHIHGDVLDVDQGAVFELMRHGRVEKQPKRKVYCVEGNGGDEFYLSRASAVRAAGGGRVLQSLPTPAHFKRSVHEAVLTVAYWCYAGTADSTTRPTMDLNHIEWKTCADTADAL